MNRRRALGAYYTPPAIAAALTDLALAPLPGAPLVCDPACGDGAFLLAAAEALARRGIARDVIVRDLLWGIDVDGGAVEATAAALREWSRGATPGDHLRVGDGLQAIDWGGRFDAVVGNPPFLNQLERATVRTADTRWPALGPYADTAFLFLLAGVELVRPGGRVLLIQPQSVAAARDAAAVRLLVAESAAIAGMWTCNEHVFDAHVRVCAPLLVRAEPPPVRVPRWSGPSVETVDDVAAPDGAAWSNLLVRRDPPPLVTLESDAPLGSIATATAGFRDQFYGLAAAVVNEPEGDRPKVVTCGVIDVGACRWGARPVRFAGHRWTHPRVDLDAIPSPTLRRWVDNRLVPKVVLATQTKVLEAAVDVDGDWVPSTPVIALHCEPQDLFAVGAMLLAPPVSAWAAATFAGTALSSDAIKLSARDVLTIPLPANPRKWRQGADALREGDVPGAAAHLTDAYGSAPEVYDWWANRWQ